MSKKDPGKHGKNTFLLISVMQLVFEAPCLLVDVELYAPNMSVVPCSGLEILQQNHAKIFPPSCNMDYHLFTLLRRCLESAIILRLTS